MDSESFYFNLKKAAIFQTVVWEKRFKLGLIIQLRKILFWLFLILFILFLYGFLFEIFPKYNLSLLLGLSMIFLTLSLAGWYKELFFNAKLKKPRLLYASFGGQAKLLEEAISNPGKYNLAEFLSFEVAKAAFRAVKFARAKKLSAINSSLLLYFLLSGNPKLNFVLSRAILDLNEIKKILEAHFKVLKSDYNPPTASSRFQRAPKFNEIYSKDFQDSIFESLKIALKKGHQRVEIVDILVALAKNDLIFKKILIDSDLKMEDVENLTRWLESLEEKIAERKRFWEYRNLAKKGSLAKEWAAGYTITLDKFAIDWTDFIRKRGFEEIIGHKEAIAQIERVLSRIEINNVLLVGEPGSGRGSIIQALAQKSIFGESLPNLNYKRVVELDVSSLLTQVEDYEKVEMILDKIFQEVIAAGNIILVINEFHNFVGQLVRPGIIDISGVLTPYLKSPEFKIVAITTYAGLHKYIEQNSSILSLFEKVEVTEISAEETIILLENLALSLEQKYKKFVTYPAIRQLVTFSAKYLPSIPFPKKAMDLLDEIMVYVARSTKDPLVLPKHVANVISEKTQIPIGELGVKEKEILLNLEDLLHQRIIDQEEAVKEVATAMRRTRAEVTIRKGPMGVFLFLGPTGVGKTETSKALAETYFGSEDRMIRLDMSEFQNLGDIPRLIGAPGEEGLLTTKVLESPFSLILLDEFEKAHSNILNLFLQVFDEGHLTDGQGRKVDFKNSLIIATSNAGYQIILEALKKGEPMSEIKDELLDFLFKEGIFRPELINRFDAVVVFKSLTKENLLDIAELLLKKLKKNLENKGIELIITQALKEKIVELGYSPIFGAREIRRTIQDKIENVLAFALLSGQIKKGDRVEITPEEFKLKVG